MVARKAGVPAELGKRLVSAGMWHEEGHDCPRCPQPPEGHLYVHDYLMHQRSKAQAEQVRTAGQTAAKAATQVEAGAAIVVACGAALAVSSVLAHLKKA